MRDSDRYEILDDDDDRPRRGFWDEDDDFRRRPRRRCRKRMRNSGLGIISLVIGLVAMSLVFIACLGAGVLSAKNGDVDDNSPATAVLVLMFIAGGLISLIGGTVGVIGLAQSNRGKGYPLAGLILNGLVLFGVIVLVIIGSLSE